MALRCTPGKDQVSFISCTNPDKIWSSNEDTALGSGQMLSAKQGAGVLSSREEDE